MHSDSIANSVPCKGVRLFVATVVDLPCPSFTAAMTRSTSAYSAKIAQFCFSLGFLGLVLFGFRSMMFGSNTKIGMIFGVCLLGAAVLRLGSRYWLLSAFCFGLNHKIPYVKFTGAELGALVLVSTFFFRQALHLDRLFISRKPLVWAAIPFLTWMCLVWSMNPTGMFIFGSSSIGGRFYFKVILAFFSMLCLSRVLFSEIDCKLLGVSFLSGHLFSMLSGFLFGNVESSLYSPGTHYVFIPFSYLASFFLCRFSIPEMLRHFWPFVSFFCALFLAIYSGNRTAAARPILVGLLAALHFRQDRVKTFGLLLCAAFFLVILTAGQGRAWNLPFAVQRSLSFLPGKWDLRLESYGFNDDFRSELRYWAKEHIKADPWFGDGGFSLNQEAMVWTNSNRSQDSINLHVLSRNWHNVWLGMAADFGVPLSIGWGWFMLVLMYSGLLGVRGLPMNSWWETMYLYFYFLILVEFVNGFFQGGHSALTAERFFLWAGLLMAVRNGVPERA